MLRANEGTLGQFFKDNGYETGMFGKWHLGDNYPYRPEDRGFTEGTAMEAEGWGRRPMSGIMLILTVGIFTTERSLRQRGFARTCF